MGFIQADDDDDGFRNPRGRSLSDKFSGLEKRLSDTATNVTRPGVSFSIVVVAVVVDVSEALGLLLSSSSDDAGSQAVNGLL